MPNTKARDLANLLSGGGSGVPSFAGTGAIDVPAGTTEQRPVNPNSGYIRFNTSLDQLEQWTEDSGWQGISPPPVATGVSPTSYNGDSGTPFTISGGNFDSAATVKFITSSGAEYSAATVTRTNSSELIATTPQAFTVADEPLSIKVVNGSGLSTSIDSAVDCGGVPTWNTTQTSYTIYDIMRSGYSLQLSATDPDGATVTYTKTSGNFPAGMSMSSSGLISGTPTAVGADTTSNFTIQASDGVNTTSKSFSITVKAPVVTEFSFTGSDQTLSVPSGLTKIQVFAWGAGGGGPHANNAPTNTYGGAGGYAEATISFAESAVSSFLVGVGRGGYYGGNTNADIQQYGGGGRAGAGGAGYAPNGTNWGGAGGGRAWLRVSGGSDDILTAAGGGGAGGSNDSANNAPNKAIYGELSQGGAGGGVFGRDGQVGILQESAQDGLGATQTAGGNGGYGLTNTVSQCSGNSSLLSYMAGSKYQGGRTDVSTQGCNGGGGGGAGYYGGGAGATWYGGGGGGGSSWAGTVVSANTTNSLNSSAGTTDYVNTSSTYSATIDGVSLTYSNVYIKQGNFSTPPNNSHQYYSSGVGAGGGYRADGGNAKVVVRY